MHCIFPLINLKSYILYDFSKPNCMSIVWTFLSICLTFQVHLVYSWLYASINEQSIRASNNLLQIELQASKFWFDQILMNRFIFGLIFMHWLYTMQFCLIDSKKRRECIYLRFCAICSWFLIYAFRGNSYVRIYIYHACLALALQDSFLLFLERRKQIIFKWLQDHTWHINHNSSLERQEEDVWAWTRWMSIIGCPQEQ